MKTEESIEDVMERIEQKGKEPKAPPKKYSPSPRPIWHYILPTSLVTAALIAGFFLLKNVIGGTTPEPTSQPPAIQTTESPSTANPALESIVVTPTTFIPYTITWKPGHQASGSPEIVELQPGEVLYLTASKFSVNGVNCGFVNGEVCVYLRQAASQESFTIDNYIPGETWVQIAQDTTIDEVLAERSPDFWVYPNCGNGCGLARVVADRPDGTRDSFVLTVPQKTPEPTASSPSTQQPTASSAFYWRTQGIVGSNSLTVTLQQGEVLYLSASHWMYNGYACRNENRDDMMCIFARQATGAETLTIDYLVPNNAWYGIAAGPIVNTPNGIAQEATTVDEVIQNLMPMWHQPPNCGSGCTLVIVREALTSTTFRDSRYDWDTASNTYIKQ